VSEIFICLFHLSLDTRLNGTKAFLNSFIPYCEFKSVGNDTIVG
jgi:hypothetical protein